MTLQLSDALATNAIRDLLGEEQRLMARNHARILTRIWNDSDFTGLTQNAQWVYQMLLSEPTLSHAGVLSLTARRWARRAKDITAERIMDGIHELAAARFVVLDEDTEEVLVRSLIRNDGVWKQPKILACAIDEAALITSEPIRAAVMEELKRIDPSGLSDKVKPDVITLLETLPEELTQARSDAPPEGPAHPPRNPPPNGHPHGPAEGARGRGGYGKSRSNTPATSTRPRSTLLGNALLDEHLRACAIQPPRKVKQRTGEAIDALLDEGVDPDRIRAGLALMRSRPGKGPGLLADLVHEAATVTQLRPTGTDGRFAPGSGSDVPPRDSYDPKRFI